MFNVEEGLNSHSSASSSDSEYDDSNQSNDSVGPCGIDKLNLVSNRYGYKIVYFYFCTHVSRYVVNRFDFLFVHIM